jgi:hypothetical protein
VIAFALLWGLFCGAFPFFFGPQLRRKIYHHPKRYAFGRDWQHLHQRLKDHALGLIWALAGYQIHAHPRGSYCYLEDLESIEKIGHLLSVFRGKYRRTLAALPSSHHLVTVVVHGMLGDTILSSATWLVGSTLSGMDVYDCVVVVLEVAGAVIAVPAVRVLTGTSLMAEIAKAMDDPEIVPSGFR